MSHFDRPILTRTVRRLAFLVMFAVLLALALIFVGPAVNSHFAQTATVGHYEPTVTIGHFGQPNTPIGYHGPTAIISNWGQPDVIPYY